MGTNTRPAGAGCIEGTRGGGLSHGTPLGYSSIYAVGLSKLLLAQAACAALLALAFATGAPPSNAATGPCPTDMRLVEGEHFTAIEHECTDERGNRCFAYQPGVVRSTEPRDAVRVCMDAFEAPNVKGARPLVMKSAPEAEAWCRAKGRRLCTEAEWETACEGPEHRPFVYGWKQDGTQCNSSKAWRAFNEGALRAGGEEAAAEVARLWQGEGAGARKACASKEGVFDLTGNVEEWVTSSPGRAFRTTLKGGFWAKPWTTCRGSNDAHDPGFRFYEVGFRCCADPQGTGSP